MTTPTPIELYVGYDWSIPVTLTDASGNPLDISTWTLGGDLWLPFQPASTPLTAQNVNEGAASFQFFVPRSVTGTIKPQTACATQFPCRILVNYTDGNSDKVALGPIYILPLDPRTA